MLKIFIYNEENRWIEETQILLFHDICAFIDTEHEKIYIWEGPNIKRARKRKAEAQLFSLLSENSDKNWNIIENQNKFPSEITNQIENMLELAKENKKRGKLKYSKFSTIRITFAIITISSFLKILSIFYIASLLFLPSNTSSYQISSTNYFFMLFVYRIITISTLILFSINLLIAFYEKDFWLIILSIIVISIDIGILLYISQGIFLFLFQEGSTDILFLIPKSDFIFFIILNLMALLIETIPIVYETVSFSKTYKKYIFIPN
ncbi:MAG: membrane protein of unknown function [Promethearchaeota archaeon]|nr:MAG: membrane protein of unknown function [Candidatus Lokiarchaeota archaeon]